MESNTTQACQSDRLARKKRLRGRVAAYLRHDVGVPLEAGLVFPFLDVPRVHAASHTAAVQQTVRGLPAHRELGVGSRPHAALLVAELARIRRRGKQKEY